MEHQAILDFWFGSADNDLEILEQKSSLWWAKGDSADSEIKSRFTATLNNLIEGKLTDWKLLPEGRLAMVILADQFSRHIFRDNEKAFAQDELALALVLEGLDSNIDLEIGLLQRAFFYMPLEHSESLSMQDRSVAMYRQLYDMAPENIHEQIKGNLNYAIAHRDIIEKFGRFPHRNVILGRQSTPEEIEYLKQPGSGF